ncbi:unnamed protein product [Lymnaea stagnalis]|uniref:NERD domain-containing protein n=1 Tax=Lymnaea stagnalis TaxID=6523 RepID=A0AAV2I5T6_LYMST
MTKRKKNKSQPPDGKPNSIDAEVTDLIIRIRETDNSSGTRTEMFREEALVDFLQKNVEQLYPRIGWETYRVPDVHMNKGKEGKKFDDTIAECPPRQETDSRSDRAHSFVSDMIYNLSLELREMRIPPFFIISSYEYDHFLSRLKAHFDTKPNASEMKEVNVPKGSGHERGEVDIMIVLPGHVIFVEVKAVGDNFGEYACDRKGVIRQTLEKAGHQLVRDVEVFRHVFKDLDLDNFRLTKIAALPNLDRKSVHDTLTENSELQEKCQDYKFLCKEDMPKDRYKYQTDFEVFKKWWLQNVFSREETKHLTYKFLILIFTLKVCSCLFVVLQALKAQSEEEERTAMNQVKVIVGRYVGFLSVVSVSTNSNSTLHRIEVRRKGQATWLVGKRFSDIVLTDSQMTYIRHNIKLGYLCGPPGSGKTVVLAVRARRWILDKQNYVVVVNMYRGAPGRAIGKQIFKTITDNSNEDLKKKLVDHCLEIEIDVETFKKEDFLVGIKAKWDDIGQQGEKLLFLVDEIYVERYWQCVLNSLREDFAESSLWFAGLYGKQPSGFETMELKKVIRCPPKIQSVLMLIDWDDNRKSCYVRDGTTADLPTDGPTVLTIRHLHHGEFAKRPPAQCLLCGAALLRLFQDELHVEKPGKGHEQSDLKECSLKCSDVLFLVNMPRSKYKADSDGYLDASVDTYKDFMKSFIDCPMLTALTDAGYPIAVHKKLNCPGLISDIPNEVINVTWIYTYQGLENKVIVFIPGDEGLPEDADLERYLVDPLLNIPCPGLQGQKVEQDSGSECSNSSCTDSEDNEEVLKPGQDKHLNKLPESSQDFGEIPDQHVQALLSESFHFREEDVNRYSRWDKNNLFITASRCTAQLILITR